MAMKNNNNHKKVPSETDVSPKAISGRMDRMEISVGRPQSPKAGPKRCHKGVVCNKYLQK